MRRLLAVGMLACGLMMSAKTLTPEEALQRVYGDPGEMAKAPSTEKYMLTKTMTDRAGQPMVYMFESNADSWMVVSASDLALPLLGYGDGDSFAGELPPQMEWWLGRYVERIAWADSLSQAGHPVRIFHADAESTRHNTQARASREVIPSLMSTKWNQDNPYNKLCPRIALQKAPTGCVATALAQIMKYHQYPEAGTGTGYATVGDSSQHLEMDLSTPLRWADMKNAYTGSSYTSSQADAVAELMVTVGYGVHMNYNLDGSGASSTDAARSMVENFGYANSTWLYTRDFYTLEDWEDMLYEEISSGRPVYYTGYASDGGHAFVCDGYAGDGYFKFNWGWGGYYNGNFKIDALNPEGQGIGGYEGGYNSNQMAIMGLEPYFEGATHPAPTLSTFDNPNATFNGDVMTLYAGWYNYGFETTTFTVGVEVENVATGEIRIKETGTHTVASYYGLNSIQLWLDPSIYPDGEYRMQIVTKTEEYPDWIPATHPVALESRLTCTKSNGKWFASKDLPLQVIDSTYPQTLTMDEPASFTITVENVNDYELTQDYEIYVCAITDNGGAYIAAEPDESDFFSLTLAANSTETVTREFTLVDFDPDVVSGYDLYLVLVNPETFQIDYSFGKVELLGAGVLIKTLSLNKTQITAEEGAEIQLTARIKPANATNQTLDWNSSDETVATVDNTGLVKIMSVGECDITASTTDGSNLTATCHVTGVSGVGMTIEDLEKATIHTLDGVRVNENPKTLKSGVYIVNGKKVIL